MRKFFTVAMIFSLALAMAVPASAFNSGWTTRDEPRMGFVAGQMDFDGLESFTTIGARFQARNFLTQVQIGTTEQESGNVEYDWADGSVNFAPAMDLNRQTQFIPYGGLGYTHFDRTTAPTDTAGALGVNTGAEFRFLLPGRQQTPQVVVGGSYRLYSSDDLELSNTTPNSQSQVYAALTFHF